MAPNPPTESAGRGPRSKRAGEVFSNEHLDLLAHVLDDWFRIPGTSIRFGLDGIVGLVPGIGDIAAGLASTVILAAGWFRGLRFITLTRMVVNIALDVLIGAIPFVGDIFDIAWKANRRNYKLLTSRLGERRSQTWRDWLFLLCLAAALFLIFVAPMLMVLWALEWFFHHA